MTEKQDQDQDREQAISALQAITMIMVDRCLPFIKDHYENIGISDCVLADFRKGISDWFMLVEVTKTDPIPTIVPKNGKKVDFVFLANDGGMEGNLLLHPQPDGKIQYDLVVSYPVKVDSEGFNNYLDIFSRVSTHPMHQVAKART